MPGLNQLRKFSNDIQKLGDEAKIRAKRGEIQPVVPFPQGISEDDDSDDFIVGIPEPKETDSSENLDDVSSVSEDSQDIQLDDLLPEADSDTAAEDVAVADEPTKDPSLDELLGSVTDNVSGIDENFDLNGLDNLDNLGTVDSSEPLDFSDLDNIAATDSTADAETTTNIEETGNPDSVPDIGADSLDDFINDTSATAAPSADSADPLAGFDLDSVLPESADSQENASENLDGLDSVADTDSALPDDISLPDLDASSSDSQDSSEPFEPAVAADENDSENPLAEDIGADTLSVEPAGDGEDNSSAFPMDDLANFDIDNAISSGESGEVPSDSETPADNFNAELAGPAENAEIPDATLEVPSEPFEMPELSAMDESIDFDGKSSGDGEKKTGDEEFPVTEPGGFSGGDDFLLSDDFEIPGFSDTEDADFGPKKARVDTADFSKASGGRPKNTLTDDEYSIFKKNLAAYPLNLRIVIEEFIAKNEFTDDAVFEVIEKILSKTPARQLASQMEKMLDVTIDVPRDYERRSFAQYQAYKQSFQYQLKNRIIPFAIIGVVLLFVGIGLFNLGRIFVYKPIRAYLAYKEGYALIQNNEFPQSEVCFDEAVDYRPMKGWFFKFARGYREKKQYERAAKMYKNILGYFNFDKNAGLEYAEMELYDRANYEQAEKIVRRDVLDHHINDADGILLLGDIFLEWAWEDPEKYESARKVYTELIERYGENDTSLSRMLRYYIRTDRLREVLIYKNMFYPDRKKLSPADWTELSGYLLEKLYGPLSIGDEYLRSSIEDVKKMLDYAERGNPKDPVARYNMAKYYIYNGDKVFAVAEMENAIDLFNKSTVRSKTNTYRQIDASRILGELYISSNEYLKAQTVFTGGINLFKSENEKTGLEGDEHTGRLFADMGDIDYFINGDLDSALRNYETAIRIKNDTPTLNFRVGAIRYGKQDYDKALHSFLKVHEEVPTDENLLLSLANTLSLKGDNFAAQGYYKELLAQLDDERSRHSLSKPQSDEDDRRIVDMYVKTNNNLGITLYRLAKQTGDSEYNAEAMVRLSDSMRAYDAATRNPTSMIRMAGSNLAAQNSEYIFKSYPDFEPGIYTDIPKVLTGEKILTQ
ncbi:periplasmic flagellar collar protein FlcA [Treponema zioleckii]|uniref:periplasmic flagellar collar protein FlcA n=1 Tax=Treponema zioleckii TaxID=331680 RepID=UPI00168BAAAB|nr:hypothetical protein [Treponema zioleckii]